MEWPPKITHIKGSRRKVPTKFYLYRKTILGTYMCNDRNKFWLCFWIIFINIYVYWGFRRVIFRADPNRNMFIKVSYQGFRREVKWRKTFLTRNEGFGVKRRKKTRYNSYTTMNIVSKLFLLRVRFSDRIIYKN